MKLPKPPKDNLTTIIVVAFVVCILALGVSINVLVYGIKQAGGLHHIAVEATKELKQLIKKAI
jgi:hypothetical protein